MDEERLRRVADLEAKRTSLADQVENLERADSGLRAELAEGESAQVKLRISEPAVMDIVRDILKDVRAELSK